MLSNNLQANVLSQSGNVGLGNTNAGIDQRYAHLVKDQYVDAAAQQAIGSGFQGLKSKSESITESMFMKSPFMEMVLKISQELQGAHSNINHLNSRLLPVRDISLCTDSNKEVPAVKQVSDVENILSGVLDELRELNSKLSQITTELRI